MVTAKRVFTRNDVWLVDLNPAIGSEIQKIRPAIIISPDEMNNTLNTVILAPMTTTIKKWPSRVNVLFQNTKGQVALDQMRALDKTRLRKRLGSVEQKTAKQISDSLIEMFR